MSGSPNRTITPRYFEGQRLEDWLKQEIEWPAGLSLRETRLHRVWAGRHGRIAFELVLSLRSGESTVTHFLQGVFGGGIPAFRPVKAACIREHGVASVRVANRELCVWCCSPDRDPALPIVSQLLDARRVASLLRPTAASPILGLDDDEVQLNCTVMGYRAARRCALRVSRPDAPGANAVFVKAHRRAPPHTQLAAVANLAADLHARSSGRVRIPALIDEVRDERLLIMAAVAGGPIPLELNGYDLALAANALAMLHGSDFDASIPCHAPTGEFQTVCRWVRGLKVLQEERYLRLRELATELRESLHGVEAAGVTLIHRDFYAAQMLRDEETLWLVDFDTLSTGHPELDVATFVAHLFLDGLQDDESTATLSDTGERFIGSYRDDGGRLLSKRFRFYLACAMARLGAMHLVRGVPARVVDELWTLAERSLSGTWCLE